MNGAQNKINKAKLIEFKISKWICYIVGVLVIIFFTLLTLSLPYCIVFVFFGIFMIWYGLRCKKKVDLANQYVDIIKDKESYSISQLAKESGVPEDVAKKNLETLIKSDFFKDTFIRESENTVYFGKPKYRFSSAATNCPVRMTAVVCKACGASAQVEKGSSAKCEYCGTYIQG